MYWHLSSMPELQHLGHEQRCQLLQQACGRLYTTRLVLRSVLRGFAFTFLLTMLFVGLLSNVLRAGQNTSAEILLLTLAPVCWALLSLMLYQRTLGKISSQMRDYFREQKELGIQTPVCLTCGYAIEGECASCPECGAGI